MNPKLLHRLIIGIFVSLYLITSTISTIHSIDFFQISNSYAMSIFLAIAFEVGAGSSLMALVIKDKMNMFLVWSIFIILTLFQIMNNVYFSFMHLGDFSKWSELFGLNEEDVLIQKRIISIVLGAVLPLIALGFIKALVDYINPVKVEKENFLETDEIIQKGKDEIKTIKEPFNENIENITEDNKEEARSMAKRKRTVKLPKGKNNEKLTKVNEMQNIVNSDLPIESFTQNSPEIDSILNDDLGQNLNTIRRGGM